MHYLFSAWMFTDCILALDFAVRFAWSNERKYRENRLMTALCFASALWSGSFAALFLQTDTELAYICRCVGMVGTFMYLITAQVLVCRISGISKRFRRLFNGISFAGIPVYFLTIKKGEVVYQLTDDGITYYFKPGFCNNVYIIYVVILSLDILAVTIYMIRYAKVKRVQVFGKKFMLVEGLIVLGMLFDTIFPMLGFGAIPGSSITQFFGLLVVENAVSRLNRARINIGNMSGFIYYSLAVPTLVYDAKRRLQIMNDAAVAFLKTDQDTQPPEGLLVSQLFDVGGEDIFTFDEERRDVDTVCKTNLVDCSLAINKIRDAYGDIIGYIILVTDLTERVKTVQRLEEAIREADAANQAKSTFLANMSHEIRTPMNVIIGFSELLLKMNLGMQERDYVEDIKDSSENLLAIINDLLDISKIESGKMELVCSEYYIGTVFQDIFLIINTQAKRKGLKFYVSISPDMPNKLYGDKIRIRGILINLLGNAVKYTKEGSVSLEAGVRKWDGDIVTIEFRVSDTGVGIREEEQERIFESFSQVDYKVHYGVEGTGLGLAIVKGYVTLMNGDVTVESEYGEGSVFTATIEQRVVDARPVDKFEGKEVKADDFSIGEMKMPGVRALVVDDNQINLKVAGSTLGYYGLTVDTASSGPEAIELCKENRYRIIFMDQMMPQMDGVEAMHEIRRLDPYYDHGGPCKMIVLTANAISGVRQQMLEAGFDEYLGKPMNFKQLERLFRKFIPEETIQTTVGNNAGRMEEDSGQSRLDAWREALPSLDVGEGVMYCGGRLDSYIEVLQIVCAKGPGQLAELKELQERRDYEEYTIRIHGIKSSTRSIGAKAVSEMAKAQEAAGREGAYAYIDAHREEFDLVYRRLLAQIAAALDHFGIDHAETNVDEKETKALTRADVAQALKSVLTSIDEYDFASAVKTLRGLKAEELPEECRADVEQISGWMDDMEDEKIRELVESRYG